MRIDVRTLAEAEAAIAAGKPINIVAGDFVLRISSGHADVAAMPGVAARVEARDTARVAATGSARVAATGSARVEARGSARVAAWGSARVVATGSASVEAMDTARVVAWESARVVARGSASVEAWGSVSVVARDSVSVVARGNASVVAGGYARVEAMDTASVEAWGSARVVAWDSARVVAWDSARVVASGSVSVVARDSARLRLYGPYVTARAADTVAVDLWRGAKCDGGRQQVVSLSTPQDWCDYYGVRIEDGCAIVYKAVGANYVSPHGVTYAPGTMPTDPAWDGEGRECAKGGGLNFSPTPRHTHRFLPAPAHYLECRIRLDEMVVHFDGRFPQKCCAPRVVAPLVEVDVDGVPVVAA